MKNFLGSRRLIASLLFVFIFSINLISQAQDILYGLTQNGGVSDQGVAYRINTDGSNFIVLRHFDGNNGGKPGNGSGFIQMSLLNGPAEGMTALTSAGNQNLGMRVTGNISNGSLTPVSFQFTENSTGTNPHGRFLWASNGNLYGMTSVKGFRGGGSLFSVSTYGNVPTSIIHFDGVATGRFPKGSLIEGPNRVLYGMTEFGGTSDMGVIFSYSIAPPLKFTKLFDFSGATNGSHPTGNLLFSSDGKLYGMTQSGGASGHGVIFRINTDGSGFTKIIDLNGPTTGSHPMGSLVQFTDGKLYGLTSSGGANGFGTIFSLTSDGEFTVILDFDGANGKSPVGDLLVNPSGTAMYGVTFAGGANDKGILFKLESGNQFVKLYDFTQETGSNPVGTMLLKRKTPEITFPEIPVQTMLSEPFTPEVSSLSGLPVYFTSSYPEIASIENNQVKINAVGNISINANQIGNHEYLPDSKQQLLKIVKIDQTVDFPPIPTKIYGDAPFTLTATASSGLPVYFSAFSNDVFSYNGTTFTITGAGKVTIRAIQPGNEIYNEAMMERELVVNRAEQTINFNPPSPITCCQSFGLNATSSGNVTVNFKTPDWEKLEINGNYASIHGLGEAKIIAYNEGNRNYKPTETQATINIDKGSQTISFYLPNGTFKLGDPDVYIGSYYSSAGLPITFTSNPAGIAVIEGNYLKFLGAGTTTITASQNGSNLIHPATPIARTLTVGPPLTPGEGNTITWNDLGTKYTLDPPFNLSAKASSGLPVSYTSSNTAVAEVSGNLVTIKSAGTTTITASQPGNESIPAATSMQKVLTVTRQYQSIYLPSMYAVSYGAAPIQMPSRSSGQLPLTYWTTNEAVAYVDSDYLLHITGSGIVTISATQAGDINYLPASPVSIQINVQPLYQTLTFDPLPEKTFGDPPFIVTATASSGRPVTFSSSNSSIASIEGSTITIKNAGTVNITARQSGVPGYNNVEVTRQLVIDKATQVITFPELPQKKFSDYPFTISATASSGLPITFSSSNTSVAKVAGNKISIYGTGAVEIMATQAGNENYHPAEARRMLEVTDAGTTYNIIGATYGGGPNTSGTIFSMSSNGANYTIMKQFEPRANPAPLGGFVKGTDGRMYGNFSWSGKYNNGRIIRLEEDGTGLTTLHDYNHDDDGSSPYGNVMQGSDGYLYSMTRVGGSYGGGSIVKVNIDGTGFAVLHHFAPEDGNSSWGGLVEASDGRLYGMTGNAGLIGYGTIFGINKDGSDFKVIYRFDDNDPVKSGYSPIGDLVQGPDGYLYGTLSSGGDNRMGILFKIMADGSNFTKLVKFDGIVTGSNPKSTPLIASDGKIYGTTQTGGTSNEGVLYAVNTDGTDFTILVNFSRTISGSYPMAQLTEGNDGMLYGMTNLGGTYLKGTIYKVNKDGTGFRKLIDLGSGAASPYYGPLLEMTPGKFFGTTFSGGTSNGGTIFSVTSEGVFSVVNNFPQQESNPGVLISDGTGEFYYGFTVNGGTNGYGTIFRIGKTGIYQTLSSLPAGIVPYHLYHMSNGYLWFVGSQNAQRVIFRIKSDGSQYDPLNEINSKINSEIHWLAETKDGRIIGVAAYSKIFFSVNSDGTGFSKISDLPSGIEFSRNCFFYASDDNVYAVSTYSREFYRFTLTGSVEKLATLPNDIGQVPMKIIEMNGGGIGVIMRDLAILSVEKDGSSYAKIFTQSFEKGSSPKDMVQTADGWIYVAASDGGANSKGVIYKIRSDGTSYTKIHEYNGEDGDVPNTIIFSKAEQLVTFDPIPKKKVSDDSFLPQATVNSGCRIYFSSNNPDVAIIEEGKVKIVGVGTATITASVPANINYYKALDVHRELVVEKSSQTIVFPNPGDQVFGSNPFQIQATSTSGLPVSFSTTSDKISILGSTVTILKPGETFIDANQLGSDTFEAAPMVTNTFCINPTKPVITARNTISGMILTSSNNAGNQWYLNDEILNGSTGESLTVTIPGSYTVVTTADVCVSDVSTPYVHVVTEIDSDPEISVKTYPNPISKEVNIEFSGKLSSKIRIELVDGLGRTVETKEVTGNGVATFNVQNQQSGIYLIKVTSERGSIVKKIVKQ